MYLFSTDINEYYICVHVVGIVYDTLIYDSGCAISVMSSHVPYETTCSDYTFVVPITVLLRKTFQIILHVVQKMVLTTVISL